MQLLAAFLIKYPKINLDVAFHDAPSDLVKDRFDIAIRRSSQVDPSSVARLLCNSSVILVASPDYLARKGIPKTPRDLDKHEWTAATIPPGQSFDMCLKPIVPGEHLTSINAPVEEPQCSEIEADHAVLNNREFGDRNEYTVQQYPNRMSFSEGRNTTLLAALSGIGLTLVSVYPALRYLRSGDLKIVLPDYQVALDGKIYIQYPHRAHLAPKNRALIDFLVDRLSSNTEVNCEPAMLRQYAAT